jgi:hypothetical protein
MRGRAEFKKITLANILAHNFLNSQCKMHRAPSLPPAFAGRQARYVLGYISSVEFKVEDFIYYELRVKVFEYIEKIRQQ